MEEDPYIGEIRILGCRLAPLGWAFCDGAELSIAQHPDLFAVVGNRFGGDVKTTFALPRLQGRVPVGMGEGPGLSDRLLGSKFGEEKIPMAASEMAEHNHLFNFRVLPTGGKTADLKNDPEGNWKTRLTLAGTTTLINTCVTGGITDSTFHQSTISVTGGTQPHENRQPFLALNFCIALKGIFPMRR